MKALLSIALLVTSTAVFADSWRDIDASLTCEATSTADGDATVKISSSEAGTKITIGKTTLSSPNRLQVMSEGNVYIQQVVNNKYNLFLSDRDLGEVLAAPAGKKFRAEDVGGSLGLFNVDPNREFKLSCSGSVITR